MKLTELLEKITPLPWKYNGMVLSEVAMPPAGVEENKIYAAHAANVLPELVKWSRARLECDQFGMSFDDFVKKYNCSPDEARRRLREAIARAEEIKLP